MMTDREHASLNWPAARAGHGQTRRPLASCERREQIAHVRRVPHRKQPSLFRCVAKTTLPFFFGLLFHLQIIPSNQQESPLSLNAAVGGGGGGGAGSHQLVRYGSGGSSAAAAKQITRRSYNAGQGGGQGPDAPKLIPLSALDRYQEGTDLRLFCSASAPKSGGRLYFEWRKNQNELLSEPSSSPLGGSVGATVSRALTETSSYSDGSEIAGLASSSSSSSLAANKQAAARLQISMMDESASVLRISSLEASDAGNYTCLVRNQQGFDSSTVRVNILVKMKWIVEPPSELRVRAGKLVQLECDASGQPTPLISWTSLKDHQTINSKLLRIDRISQNDSGMYECRATRALAAGSGGHHQQQQQQHRDHGSEQLRKLVRLIVDGKC